ncbi:MAG: hypothetical protein ACP5HC_06395 [Caldisericum sp.]
MDAKELLEFLEKQIDKAKREYAENAESAFVRGFCEGELFAYEVLEAFVRFKSGQNKEDRD